jgi:hypothetical protein
VIYRPVLCVVIREMLGKCCYVIVVTVDITGTVWEKTIAGCHVAPGTARAAARVAHYPPTVARGPMALALRLVRNEIIIIITVELTLRF